MIVLDTTVLVYATGVEHLYRDPCETDLQLFGRNTWPGAFDAVLASAAADAGATAVVSADRAFAEIEIAHVVPDADGVVSVLDATEP